jgi:DNA invertase Pin-like site-specific DNA recombinase
MTISSPAASDAANSVDHVHRARAYSYVRFSTKRQSKGDSLERQLDQSRAYAAEFNLDLQEHAYDDLGISAFDSSNVIKGALAAFLKAVENGHIERGSYLLVENLDRLSRAQLFEAMALLDRLVKLGIRVVSLADRRVLDEETVREPMNLMWAVFVFIRANEESQTKSMRITSSHKRKRDNRLPFAFGQGPGWLRPNNTKTGWEVIPERAESVIKVFEHSARGIGSTAIARIANAEGWPVPGRAKDWHKTLPHKLLRNRRLLGELEPQVKDGKVRRPTGDCWENYYPSVISQELFSAAQGAAERRRILPKRRDIGYHNVFQGFLRCGHCGATLSRKSKSSVRNSPGYAQYVCADRDRGVTACPNWNARQLEDALIRPLMTCVSAEILDGNVKKDALKALEIERALLTSEKKALENLMSIVERTGPSDPLAARIRELGASVTQRRVRVVELSAVSNDPVSAVWEEDLDAAICDAVTALRDVTDEFMLQRAALHQNFTRVVRRLWVWPKSHAAIQLHNDDTKILVPLATKAPLQASFDGKAFIVPIV